MKNKQFFILYDLIDTENRSEDYKQIEQELIRADAGAEKVLKNVWCISVPEDEDVESLHRQFKEFFTCDDKLLIVESSAAYGNTIKNPSAHLLKRIYFLSDVSQD
ncbi:MULTISPECIES: hypothetical protein [Nostoc]|uniref:Uncharacterized protein n=2 Tax=Nostoc TaxID=1177 RepID=A0ABR8IF43_9NOSO|nr:MULTISPECIES: hypothetical protein [Nostoc]MBD2562073.1 hypothetical protein [Nostoc linckia FACHB-391]MBD2649504.1 hypothetical protein [Nostoc foliaceum FACHB-393]